jgi:anti-sigma regulatory factor (Ser/Thr protein kinase)
VVSEPQWATFPASPTSPRAARSFVRGVFPEVSEAEIADVIMLLVTELVTNAVMHAHSPVRVHVVVDDHQVRVAVHDDVPQPPVRRRASEEALGGRGLLLLDRLSDRWGYDSHPPGKTVWFEIGTGAAARGTT